MERRKANVIINTAGGTAAKHAKTYKIALPSAWINTLSITDDDREMELTFDGTHIILSRPVGCDEFIKRALAQKHDVRRLRFYDGDTLCTTICADFTDKTICAENHIENPIKTAFGNNMLPVWEDFEAFLAERCIPQSRAGLREYLDAIGVSEYDPLEIISKTSGRMAEDNQWIEIVSLREPSEVQ